MMLPLIGVLFGVVLLVSVCGFFAIRAELASRAGRHRGIYQFADRHCEREAYSLDPDPEPASTEPLPPGFHETDDGNLMWLGSVYVPTLLEPGVSATLTLASSDPVMTLPALFGPPVEPPHPWIGDVEISDVDGPSKSSLELVNPDTAEYRLVVAVGNPEPVLSAEALMYQHERVYHPLASQ